MGNRAAIIAAAALLAACQGETAPPPTPAPEGAADVTEGSAELAAATKLCRTVAGASDSGNESLRAAFVSTPEGRDYGGGVIAQLVKQNGYSFLGADMVGSNCYAYAGANGEEWGKTFNLKWRCPVKLVSDSPTEAGKTLVQVVDDKQCDLDAERGAPKRQDVYVELLHM